MSKGETRVRPKDVCVFGAFINKVNAPEEKEQIGIEI